MADDGRYDVILLRDLLPGQSSGVVAARLAAAFGTELAAMTELLGQAPAPVKRNADAATARQYADALRRAGAQCEILPAAVATEAPVVRSGAGEVRSTQQATRALGVPEWALDNAPLSHGAAPSRPLPAAPSAPPPVKRSPPSKPDPGPEEIPAGVGATAAASGITPVVLYVRPFKAVAWPERCIGCFCEAPNETLDMALRGLPQPEAVESATGAGGAVAATAGGIIGGVAGEVAGVLGGFVGGAIARAAISGVMSSGIDSAVEYTIPICAGCHATLSEAERSELAGEEERVETSVVARSFLSGLLALEFASAQYEAEFRRLNGALVSDDPQAALAARSKPKVEAPEAPRGDARMGLDGEPIAKRVVAHLATFLPQAGLAITPEIPQKKILAARRACGVASAVEVLALWDLTLFGSSKKCIMFSTLGVHFANGDKARLPRGRVTYDQLKVCSLRVDADSRLDLGRGQILDLAANPGEREVLVRMLTSIKWGLNPPPPGT